MQKRSWPIAAGAAWLLWGILCVLGPGLPAQAAGKKEMTGTWYAELKEAGQFNGKRYDIRRQLTTNRADGTKVVTFRYYAGAQLLGEVVTNYRWGAENDVYWTECQTTNSGGSFAPCAGRIEYDLVAASAYTLRYKSRQSGITYDLTRVREDFRLP
jgi:hypothetical protein